MATGLTAFVQQKRDNYIALIQQAQLDFSIASQSLFSALDDYEVLIGEAAELDELISAIRQQMALVSNMPADINALAEELRTMLIDRRHNTAALADGGENVNQAKIIVAGHEADIVEVNKLLNAAEAELEKVELMGEHHSAWTASDLEDEITVVRDTSTALLTDSFTPDPDDEINPAEILATAKSRIESDIPEVLRDRARVRAGFITDKISGFQSVKDFTSTSLHSHIASMTGSSGLLKQRKAEYEIAENHLKHYALTSLDQYERAVNMLISIADSKELTPAESDVIAAMALAVDSDAVTTEAALHAARAAAAAKKIELEQADIAARIVDINSDPTSDADVQARQSELDTLESELAAAESAHTEAFELELDLWEAVIPNFIWANLQLYDTALALLSGLSSSDGGALTTAFTDAEALLVSTITTHDNNQKLSHYLKASADAAANRNNYLVNVRTSVSLSSMRGDY